MGATLIDAMDNEYRPDETLSCNPGARRALRFGLNSSSLLFPIRGYRNRHSLFLVRRRTGLHNVVHEPNPRVVTVQSRHRGLVRRSA